MRSGSTSGRLSRKSSERTAFHVCRPITLCRWASACGLKRPQFSVVFISGRCLANLWISSGENWIESESLSMSHCQTTQPMRASWTHIDWKHAAAAVLEAFLAGGDFFLDGIVARLGEPGVLPVAVGEQHAGNFARDLLWPVEIAGDEEAGRTLEIDFFDRVVGPLDLAVDDGVQRRLGRHRPEAFGHENLPAHAFGPSVPFRLRLGRREWEIAVEVLERLQSDIVRQRPGRQCARRGSFERRNERQESRKHAE